MYTVEPAKSDTSSIRIICRIRKVKMYNKRSFEIMSDRDNSGLYKCWISPVPLYINLYELEKLVEL